MRLDAWFRERPDMALMAPYLAYLLLLALQSIEPFDTQARWLSHVLRGVGSLAVFWLVRRHLPPWGKPHLLLAIAAGAACAVLWAGGQHVFNRLGVPMHIPLPLFTAGEISDPTTIWTNATEFWVTAVLKVAVACTAVPIVEELFWRAFLLRALIRWDDFERVPLGTFRWRSFLGTSLLSTLQHPSNWLISIFCWFAFNGLFYWKKSILFLVLVHAFTNLFLYVYVLAARDWQFW